MILKMSFWLFKPSGLISSKNVLPYKIENSEELLNFLTLAGAVVMYFMKKKLDKELWKKILITFFSTIIFLGCLIHLNKDTTENIEGMKIPKYANFSHSLTIT